MRNVAIQRKWQANDIKIKRATWLEINGPCRRCGSWNQLEVDHIDPAEKISHRIWTWRPDRRNAELAKCQPLCRQCHKDKTIKSFRRPVTHGSAGYTRGCRCEVCANNQAKRMAKYHESHPRRKSSPP